MAAPITARDPTAGTPDSSSALLSSQRALGVLPDDALTPVYGSKAHVLNAAIQKIGMGRYQCGLFCVAGFGWLADSLWTQVAGLILPAVIPELKPARIEYLALAQYRAMLGAFVWGVASDMIGRRTVFNVTLLITGVFGVAAGGMETFAAVAVMTALWSVGVGGNIPVDSAVFLEFLPGSHQWLLTAMNVWWCVGQIVASAVAWPLLTNFSCRGGDTCERGRNMGWRYFLFAMGTLTLVLFLLRFWAFKLYESPKYLMGRGNDVAAAEVVQKVARYNGVESEFGVAELSAVDTAAGGAGGAGGVQGDLGILSHLRALFATRELATSTLLILAIWFLTGLGFPLYNAFLPYFLTRHAGTTQPSQSIAYRNYLIILCMNIPGGLVAAFTVELKGLGRKGTMSIGAFMTGTFLLAGTTASTSNQLLAWNCVYGFAGTLMAGALYAYTPEVFPTNHRGTGYGLAMTANRVGGVLAPVVAMYADVDTPVPVYIAGSMFLVAGVLMLVLPFESRGKSSM